MPYQPTWQNPYQQFAWQAQPQFQQTQPQQTMPPYQSGIVRVNGRDSALQYQLPPNSMSPALFDNNGKTFYIVSTDGAGAKSIEAFDYVEHVEAQAVRPDADFVSRGEFDEFVARVGAALEALGGVQGPVSGQQQQQRSGRRRQNAKGDASGKPSGGVEQGG